MKKKAIFSLLIINSALLSGCSFIDDLYDSFGTVKSVTIDESITIQGGEEKLLTVSYEPKTANIDAMYFESKNENIAIVNEKGNVIGIDKGNTNVVLTIVSNSKTLSASCNVTVTSSYESSQTEMAYTIDQFTDNNVSTIDNCPTIGSPKLLIIPVWFTNSKAFINPSFKENVREDIKDTYLGSETDTGWHSVKTYYNQLSKGQLNLSGTVSNWYECGLSSEDVNDENDTMTLVNSAVSWYFKNNSNDSRKNYDYNNDGYLDGVMLIYGAADYQTNTKTKNRNLWAYCYWLQKLNASKISPNPNVFFWASYDFMYGKETSFSRTGYSYGGGDTSHCVLDAHTYIHEMGHVFGLEDYYDYSENEFTPAGGFSMQDMNVGSHDPFSTLLCGWSKPYVPMSSTTIKLKPFQESNDVILLTNNSNFINSPFDEYLLLEYYTPTELNELDSTYVYRNKYPNGSKKSGIRLWHVDGRLTQYSYTGYPSTNLISDPTKGNVSFAMSNSNNSDYGSPLGEKYFKYNQLQLIHNDESVFYENQVYFTDSSLFYKNDSFTLSQFSSQFPNRSKMNNNKYLGWSFTINDINSEYATITITKQ